MNLTMLTDFYEFTMTNGFLKNGMADKVAYFDMFFRRVPDKGGFAIMAGVEDMVNYLKDLKFTESDIEYLRSKNMFCEEFLEYLGAKTAVISCGKKNLYGHPDNGVMHRLLTAGVKTHRTDEEGTVVISIPKDGEYTIE